MRSFIKFVLVASVLFILSYLGVSVRMYVLNAAADAEYWRAKKPVMFCQDLAAKTTRPGWSYKSCIEEVQGAGAKRAAGLL